MKEEDSEQRIASSMSEIAKHVEGASDQVKDQPKPIRELIEQLMRVYKGNHRLFTMGEGRSGLVGMAFAMRARHLNFHAHVIGESTTPAVRINDLVIVISGSGTTTTNISRCTIIIDRVGAKIIAITSNANSPLGKLIDVTIELPGREEGETIDDYNAKRLTGIPPLAPLGTLFEINTLVFLDSLIRELMLLTETTEEEMKARHAIE